MANPNHPAAYPPSKTALLLLDYHSFIVDMMQSQEKKQDLLSQVKNLADVARENSVPVVHCLIGTDRDPLATSKVSTRWAQGIKPLVTAQPELIKESCDIVHEADFTVTRRAGVVSAMKSEGIMDFLRSKGVESLVMCGVSTSGVVASTVRDATDLGFVVSVVGDACRDPSEDAHRVVLESVVTMTAWVVDNKKGTEILQGKATET